MQNSSHQNAFFATICFINDVNKYNWKIRWNDGSAENIQILFYLESVFYVWYKTLFIEFMQVYIKEEAKYITNFVFYTLSSNLKILYMCFLMLTVFLILDDEFSVYKIVGLWIKKC